VSFASKNTSMSDLEEEILFHIEELRYHEEYFDKSIEEAALHFDKIQEHNETLARLSRVSYA
jgi:hypothetical protein